jgi:hypothetical protein
MKTIGLCLMFFASLTLQLVSDFCHGCILLYKLTGIGKLLLQGVFSGRSRARLATSDFTMAPP